MGTSPGRNDACPCGSGRKYKQCCGALGAAPPGTDGAGEAPDPQRISGLVALIEQGHLQQAERETRQLLERSPGAGILWKVLSVAQLRQGKGALEALQHAAQLLPEDAEAHGNLGSELYRAQRWPQALASLERALELNPRDLNALIEVANTLRALSRPGEAQPLYERALQIDPNEAEARNNLGNTCFELGRFAEAAAHYRQALTRRGEDASIHCNLATALQKLGSFAEAAASSRDAIERAPGLAAAHNQLGLALTGLGRRKEAIASLRRALALNPGSLEASDNLAELLREEGERREAIAICEKALEIDPRRASTYFTLGKALFDLRNLPGAVDNYRRALELSPHDSAVQLALAATLRVQGQANAALAQVEAVLRREPAGVEALALLGELRADRGQFAEALDLFGRALSLDPEYPSLYCSIAAHRRMRAEDAGWLAGVERLLSRPLPLPHQVGLNFALGKFYDDTARYEPAFEHYRRANDLSARDGARYDAAKLESHVAQLMRSFDRAGIERLQRYASGSERPVFIIGMPRSGTTLTEQIIASHPEAFGAGEVRFWDSALKEFEALPPGEGAADGFVKSIAARYLERIGSESAAATRVTDKMPANFLYAGLIHSVFPRACILHVTRHPLDTCVSIYFQNFFNMATYGRDLGSLAHYYGEYLRVMAHWRSVLPAHALLEIPYEGLVADQEGWTRRMLEFIGLPWDARCLDFQETARVVITASRWQVRQRISAASVGRWRNYERHLEPLRHLAGGHYAR